MNRNSDRKQLVLVPSAQFFFKKTTTSQRNKIYSQLILGLNAKFENKVDLSVGTIDCRLDLVQSIVSPSIKMFKWGQITADCEPLSDCPNRESSLQRRLA